MARRNTGHHAGEIAGAAHIPLHERPKRLGEVRPGVARVHCAGGTRATIAASVPDVSRQVVTGAGRV
ncbi:hypothetical protein ACWCQ6_33480, partial [Streptomyces sp. NPDC001880]